MHCCVPQLLACSRADLGLLACSRAVLGLLACEELSVGSCALGQLQRTLKPTHTILQKIGDVVRA